MYFGRCLYIRCFTATGPVRLFVPYKRKRKYLYDSDGKKSRSRNDDSSDGSDSDHIINAPVSNHSVKEEAWHNLAAGLETNSDYQLLENSETDNCIQGIFN